MTTCSTRSLPMSMRLKASSFRRTMTVWTKMPRRLCLGLDRSRRA